MESWGLTVCGLHRGSRWVIPGHVEGCKKGSARGMYQLREGHLGFPASCWAAKKETGKKQGKFREP